MSESVLRGYTYFLCEQIAMHYRTNPPPVAQLDDYHFEQAQYAFYLSVFNPLSELAGELIRFAASFQSVEAKKSLVQGAGRRAMSMWYSYREFMKIQPRRKNGMTNEERDFFSKELNALYINIRGILDNLAWALLYEFSTSPPRNQKDYGKVGLFYGILDADSQFQDLRKALNVRLPAPAIRNFYDEESECHKDWFSRLKTKRDESAHRLPLTCPP